jgi:tRNA A37 N6-isopentenylltransferase MiaA
MTKLKKKNVSKAQQELAYRYKCAWNHLFKESKEWLQKTIIAEPDGRHAKDLIQEVAKLAESNRRIPPCEND